MRPQLRIGEGRAVRAGTIMLATAIVWALALLAGSHVPSASAASGTPAVGGLAVSEGSGSVFPARSLVLTVPGRTSVSGSEVHITENGRAVNGALVTPISDAQARDFGIVLAIDVSPSMRGSSLDGAMRAARALAHRRAGQQLLGIVEFDQKASVALPLTADTAAIDKALAHTPPVGPGTHIFDALSLALQQLEARHVAAGAVILLSDGADRGSSSTEQATAAAAQAAHVTLYTVGVRNGAFDPNSLRALARDGGGQFFATDSKGLERLFTEIDSGLTSRAVVHYRSDEQPGTKVRLAVTVDGVPGVGALEYAAPLPTYFAPTAGEKSKSFWVSSTALIAFSVGAALLIAFGLAAFVAARVRRRGLRERVVEFSAAPAPVELTEEAEQHRLAGLERLLERASWWAQFKEDVEIARFERSPVELVAITIVATLAAVLLLSLVLGVPAMAVLALLFGPLALRLTVQRKLHKQRDLFASQLPNHIQELASTMRSGHSLVSGIDTLADSAVEPSRSEWKRVVADEQLGVPLEAAIRPLAARMDCADIEQIALVATLQSRSGGNMADVLERVADGVRERADLRRELISLTAQARLSRWVITGLPPGMVVILAIVHPNYLNPLFQTTAGQILLALATVMVVAGSLIMRAITNVKV
jgi:tight adherence protein B